MKMASWYRKLSVRRKIFIPFFTITLLSSTIFTGYGFFQNNRAIVNEIDKRLLIAALTMPLLLPQDYFDRVTGPASIDEVEHWRNTGNLNLFLENVGATYLYALIKEGDHYFFVASAHLGTHYWEEYMEPAPNIYEIDQYWLPNVSTTDDPEFGLLRSVVIPHKNAAGQRFIIGADIEASEVEALKRQAFMNFLLMGGASFLLAVFFSYAASCTITRPLIRLSNFTRRLIDEGFSSAIRLDPALYQDGNDTRSETAILAGNFDLMQRRLEEHITQLKLTQSARERAESELRIAGQIQETFLPPPYNPVAFDRRVDLSAFMKTAKQAGGDLYDFFALDEHRLFFAIGDVSGKGMPAAMFMSVVVVLMRSTAKVTDDPGEILRRLNDDIADRNESCTFVTLLAGILDTRTGRVAYSNGGHNAPRMINADGVVSEIKVQTNVIVGVLGDRTFAVEELTLKPGDTLLLYTDGVTEAMNVADALYGEPRMDKVLASIPPLSGTNAILKVLVDDVMAFSGEREQADDITVVALRYQAKG